MRKASFGFPPSHQLRDLLKTLKLSSLNLLDLANLSM